MSPSHQMTGLTGQLLLICDLATFLAYFSMPVALAYFARRRVDFLYRWLLWLFAAFIMSCGLHHLSLVLEYWIPHETLVIPHAVIMVVTAITSVLTAIVLWPLIPNALKLPSPSELQQLNIKLQAEVTERLLIEVELKKAKEEAEHANHAKSLFLANMSHEIRTPLNAITGMTFLLQRSGVTPQQAEQLIKIDAAGHHLLDTINAILDLSKIEAGKFALDEAEVSIGSLTANVASMLYEQAKAKKLQLLVETQPLPPHLWGDPVRLQQGLLNYASNALKFTETGTITLRSKLEEETSESVLVRFEVQDTGIGLASEQVARLFSTFEQADNSITRKFGGTGLGLALTKSFATLMGGEAGVDSTQGVGSTFWFTARLRKGTPSQQTGMASSIDSAEAILLRDYSGCRVLLVEDELINREITQTLLNDVQLSVDTAENGVEAVALVRKNDYDLILMDMQMPEMDGLEATRQIRAMPKESKTPIVAMTANAFAEDKNNCFEVGMNDFLTKPAHPQLLFAMVLKWLANKESLA